MRLYRPDGRLDDRTDVRAQRTHRTALTLAGTVERKGRNAAGMKMPLEGREFLLGRIRARDDQRQRVCAVSVRHAKNGPKFAVLKGHSDHLARRIKQGCRETVEFHLSRGGPRLCLQILEGHELSEMIKKAGAGIGFAGGHVAAGDQSRNAELCVTLALLAPGSKPLLPDAGALDDGTCGCRRDPGDLHAREPMLDDTDQSVLILRHASSPA
ncbi:hypothetical protein P4608_27740 [Ensifer adhaerens]|nr:hypothetical protein [Ensifer adhaerens]MDF8357854.1 hypothetical protein [Ensifer adhaerens]